MSDTPTCRNLENEAEGNVMVQARKSDHVT